MTEKAATNEQIALWEKTLGPGLLAHALIARIKQEQATIERYTRLILELCPEGSVKPAVQFPGRVKVNTYVYLTCEATTTLEDATDAGN